VDLELLDHIDLQPQVQRLPVDAGRLATGLGFVSRALACLTRRSAKNAAVVNPLGDKTLCVLFENEIWACLFFHSKR
jgi:hypothetical protein